MPRASARAVPNSARTKETTRRKLAAPSRRSPVRLIHGSGPPRCPRGAIPWPADVVPDRLPSLAVDAARRAVAAKLQALDLAAEEPLFSQGDRGSSVFFVIAGAVSVLVGGTELARLGPGRYFGELGLMLNDRRAASIVAAEPSSLMESSPATTFTRCLAQAQASTGLVDSSSMPAR